MNINTIYKFILGGMKLNEIVAIPSNQNLTERSNLHINKLIFLLPIVLLISNSTRGYTRKRTNVSGLGSDFLASIDIKSVHEKMDIIKKIGPYMPEHIVEPLNSVIFFIEKAATIISLMDIITTNKSYTPILPYHNLSNKERINGILSTIKDEANDEKLNTLKPVIDLALNFDKYNSLINMISSLGNVNSKTEKLSSPVSKVEIAEQNNPSKPMQLDDMINIFKPLLGNDENKINQLDSMVSAIKPMLENNQKKSNQLDSIVDALKPVLGNNQAATNEKMNDMFKMLELLNVLNSKEPKKEEQN